MLDLKSYRSTCPFAIYIMTIGSLCYLIEELWAMQIGEKMLKKGVISSYGISTSYHVSHITNVMAFSRIFTILHFIKNILIIIDIRKCFAPVIICSVQLSSLTRHLEKLNFPLVLQSEQF